MANFGQFITALAEKAGVPSDHKGLIDLLSNAELAKATVNEDLEKSLNEGLTLTFESAKNNAKLKDHFRASILNGVDAEIKRLAEEYEFDDDSKNEVVGAENTFKKMGIVAAKIKALEEKKSQAANKDKPDYTKEIERLRGEMSTLSKTHESKIQELQNQHLAELTGLSVKQILAAKKYAATQLPSEVNITTADILLQNELRNAGARIVRENGNLKLVQANDEKLDFYDKTNNKPTVEQFIDGVLAQNKLLAVSDPSPAPVGGQGNPGQQFNPPTIPAGAPDMSHIKERLQQARKDFAAHSVANPA